MKVAVIACALMFLTSVPAQSSVFISEFLADVPVQGGDANADGAISSSQDEFIELFNEGTASVNVSGWQLHDALRLRHTFTVNTEILPNSYLVVFGGGSPTIAVPFQVASTGGLGLNNSGDVIRLFDMNQMIIDQVNYGSEAGQDQSLVRAQANDDFVLHTLQDNNGALYSPGTGPGLVSEAPTASTVPEPMTWTMLLGGVIPALRYRFS